MFPSDLRKMQPISKYVDHEINEPLALASLTGSFGLERQAGRGLCLFERQLIWQSSNALFVGRRRSDWPHGPSAGMAML